MLKNIMVFDFYAKNVNVLGEQVLTFFILYILLDFMKVSFFLDKINSNHLILNFQDIFTQIIYEECLSS